MDKISDSGSDDRRSIRLGGTKKGKHVLAFFLSVVHDLAGLGMISFSAAEVQL